MKRVVAVLLTGSVLVIGGCVDYYEARLDRTLEEMKYVDRLDRNLNPAPTAAGFQEHLIYLRPPRPMTLANTFLLSDLPLGQFDVAASFYSDENAPSLHVLARRKVDRRAQDQDAPPPVDESVRGPFVNDVLGILRSYGSSEELQPERLQQVEQRANQFRRLQFSAGEASDGLVYFYNQDPYEVALIWFVPHDQRGAITSRMDLTLQSFAVGDRARRSFAGSLLDDEGAAIGSEAPAVAF